MNDLTSIKSSSSKSSSVALSSTLAREIPEADKEQWKAQRKKIEGLEKTNQELRKGLQGTMNFIVMSLLLGLIALVLTVGLSIVAIARDIYLDIDRYDMLQNQIATLTKRINESEKTDLNLYKESLGRQSILDCLKKKAENYWEYPKCF